MRWKCQPKEESVLSKLQTAEGDKSCKLWLHHTPSVSLAERSKEKAESMQLSFPLQQSTEARERLLFPDTFLEAEMTHSFSHTGEATHCSLVLRALPLASRDAVCHET